MAGRSRPVALALGPFLAGLDERLGALSAQEVREAVTDLARSLPARDRPAFLAHFGAAAPPPADEWGALARDIEALEEEAADTGEPGWDEADEWHDRYGWSPDEELAEPDWAPDLHALLGRAATLFLAGDTPRAAEAYERLFGVAADAVGQGWALTGDGGEDDALDEAAARYLRALWEATAEHERPERLRAAVTTLSDGVIASNVLSLAAVADAGPLPLAGTEVFLADWIAALGPLSKDPNASGSWAHRLLVEGVAGLQGAAGLGDLARAGGPRAGRAYLAWVDATRAEGDLEEARRAAAEAMAAPVNGGDRAALAERLATLAEHAGDEGAGAEARLAAWAAAPTLVRLLAVVHAARNAGREAEMLHSLADAASSAGHPTGVDLPPAAQAALLVLAGRLDEAIEVNHDPGRTGPPSTWAARSAQSVTVPAVLVAAADATRHERFDDLVLASLLRGADDAVDLAHPYSFADDPDDPPAPAHDLTLGGLLIEALERMTADASRRQVLFQRGAKASAEAVAAIVEAKDRRRYARAADWAIAHAEATAVAWGREAGDRVADDAGARYPRHSAYQAELARARGRSPLLSPPTRRR